MKGSLKEPRVIAIIALLLLVLIVFLGYQSFAPIHLGTESWSIGVWAPKVDARLLIRSVHLGLLAMVGLSILMILIGSSCALAVSRRAGRLLGQPVETMPGELRESHQKLLTALGSLEEAYAFQQAIIDGVADSVMVIGTDYRVKLMNQAARELSAGGDAPEPELCYEISHRRDLPCDSREEPCPLELVRTSGRPVRVLHKHFQPNGEQRTVEVIASPLWDADGSFRGIIESERDVTARVQAEKALQQHAKRLRSLTTQRAEVVEAERQRLAQELHDQVGQNLTALSINLNIIQSQITEHTTAAVHSRLTDSQSLVEQTAEQIRDVMANLRPPVLDDYGLAAALHWYGEQFRRRTNVAFAVEGNESMPRPTARVENALFRIAQEALTNVAKHAQAKQVTVTVEVDHDILRLVVADDGIGFDRELLAEPDAAQGWGLLTMTERADSVGGICRVVSHPGQGTQVIVEVPQ